MPVRDRFIENLTASVLKTELGAIVTDETAHQAMADAFETAVHKADWSRALVVAQGRHFAWDHPDRRPGIAGVCGECLGEALLVEQTAYNWMDDPDRPANRAAYPDEPPEPDSNQPL